MLYFNEYMQEGSGFPVDLTVGLRSVDQCITHGRRVCIDKGYCGFWISRKPDNTYMEPIKVEYHHRRISPSGQVVWLKPIPAISKGA